VRLPRWSSKWTPVLHPFLWAAFPILFLYAHNRQEGVVLGDLWGPLELTLGVVALLLLAGWAIFRSPQRVGLAIAAWALLFFTFGHVVGFVEGHQWLGIGADLYLLAAWAALAVGGVLLAVKLPGMPQVTQALNLVAAGLVLINVLPIAFGGANPEAPATAATIATRPLPAARRGNLPDIYYIVPDRFGRWETLQRTFGVDVRPLVEFLRQKGFYVADHSHANYENTHQSMASSLNMEYLQNLSSESSAFALLKGFQVARYLKSFGYRYVHVGSWWGPTSKDPFADVNISYGPWSEFQSTLYDTTILPTLAGRLGFGNETLDPRRRKYSNLMAEFRTAERTRFISGPKFVFMHILFPHYQGPGTPEYVVGPGGEYVTRQQELAKSYHQRYADQARFAVRKYEELISALLSGSGRQAVIVFQTDEGPYPTAQTDGKPSSYDWRDFSLPQLGDKFRIMNALYLPGVDHARLYPTMTPVNTFRLIFDLYFDAALPFLPDRSYVRLLKPFRFVDITQKVQDEGRR
jgi:hypothetical protein